MIALLLRRTLTGRPRRTILLLLGFGIAVGVMITLLSIGAAVLEQSRDADLVGGGDVVLLPVGVDVEVLKVGGATGMFYSIDNARFVFRQLLSGPRFQDRLKSVAAPQWPNEPAAPPLAAASPIIANKVVYVRRAGSAEPHRANAFGVIPSLERAVSGALLDSDGVALDWNDTVADHLWMDPPIDSLYHALDRFHLPPPGPHDLASWAEWLYFNVQDPATGAIAFVSFIVGGNWPAGQGRALPLVQIAWPDETPLRVAGDAPLAADAVRTDRCDLRFSERTTARFEQGRWQLAIDLPRSGAQPSARAAFDVEPLRDLDYPAVMIHDDAELVSGYVVPAIRAVANGWIEIGGRRLTFENAPAYHDHNWGIWRDVQWHWGTASTPEYGLLYGRVDHPALRRSPTDDSSGDAFALLSRARSATARGGLVGVFRPSRIDYEWDDAPPPLPGSPVRIPRAMRFEASGGNNSRDFLRVQARIERVLATPPRATGSPLVFLQARGAFKVEAGTSQVQASFVANGSAEVFVESNVGAAR